MERFIAGVRKKLEKLLTNDEKFKLHEAIRKKQVDKNNDCDVISEIATIFEDKYTQLDPREKNLVKIDVEPEPGETRREWSVAKGKDKLKKQLMNAIFIRDDVPDELRLILLTDMMNGMSKWPESGRVSEFYSLKYEVLKKLLEIIPKSNIHIEKSQGVNADLCVHIKVVFDKISEFFSWHTKESFIDNPDEFSNPSIKREIFWKIRSLLSNEDKEKIDRYRERGSFVIEKWHGIFFNAELISKIMNYEGITGLNYSFLDFGGGEPRDSEFTEEVKDDEELVQMVDEIPEDVQEEKTKSKQEDKELSGTKKQVLEVFKGIGDIIEKSVNRKITLGDKNIIIDGCSNTEREFYYSLPSLQAKNNYLHSLELANTCMEELKKYDFSGLNNIPGVSEDVKKLLILVNTHNVNDEWIRVITVAVALNEILQNPKFKSKELNEIYNKLTEVLQRTGSKFETAGRGKHICKLIISIDENGFVRRDKLVEYNKGYVLPDGMKFIELPLYDDKIPQLYSRDDLPKDAMALSNMEIVQIQELFSETPKKEVTYEEDNSKKKDNISDKELSSYQKEVLDVFSGLTKIDEESIKDYDFSSLEAIRDIPENVKVAFSSLSSGNFNNELVRTIMLASAMGELIKISKLRSSELVQIYSRVIEKLEMTGVVIRPGGKGRKLCQLMICIDKEGNIRTDVYGKENVVNESFDNVPEDLKFVELGLFDSIPSNQIDTYNLSREKIEQIEQDFTLSIDELQGIFSKSKDRNVVEAVYEGEGSYGDSSNEDAILEETADSIEEDTPSSSTNTLEPEEKEPNMRENIEELVSDEEMCKYIEALLPTMTDEQKLIIMESIILSMPPDKQFEFLYSGLKRFAPGDSQPPKNGNNRNGGMIK